jgi:type I restriction enzyme S subunit
VQREVVARIEELFADILEGERALHEAEDAVAVYGRALLMAAMTGGATAAWRAAHRCQPEHGAEPNLPSSWRMVELGSLIVEGPQNGLYMPKSAYGDGFPIYRIDDFQSGNARDASALRRLSADEEVVAAYSLRVGDFVLNRVNSPSHLGKSFLVREAHVPALFESNMMRFRLNDEVSAEFIELYLCSELGRAELAKNAKAAVNQSSINQGDVRAARVPLPSRAEQQEIVRRVQQLRGAVSTATSGLLSSVSNTADLRQSILAAAFRGDLVA